MATRVALLAAGTGITPCYQFLEAIAVEWMSWEDEASPSPPTVQLLYVNRTPGDVLLHDEICEIVRRVNGT
ncbi:hypothetical protein HDU67_002840, partial [Dinochytrium kinnereticum]